LSKGPFFQAFRVSQALYDAVQIAETALQEAKQLPLREYGSTPIPQELLDQEERLLLKRNGPLLQRRLSPIDISGDDIGKGDRSDIEGEEESDFDDIASVISGISAILDNRDFVRI
jgi:hypothetical protein